MSVMLTVRHFLKAKVVRQHVTKKIDVIQSYIMSTKARKNFKQTMTQNNRELRKIVNRLPSHIWPIIIEDASGIYNYESIIEASQRQRYRQLRSRFHHDIFNETTHRVRERFMRQGMSFQQAMVKTAQKMMGTFEASWEETTATRDNFYFIWKNRLPFHWA